MAAAAKPLERLADRILDLDYGDEQERLRYYETYAVAVHLQLIAMPAMGAAVVAMAGQQAILPVLAMLAVFVAPLLVGLNHLERHRVPAEAIASSERNRGFLRFYGVSCLALVVAIALRADLSGFEGALVVVGVAAGLAIGAIVHTAETQRSQDTEA